MWNTSLARKIRPLYRNNSNYIVNRDLIYTHPIDHHQILSIANPNNAFSLLVRRKKHGTVGRWDGEI